MTDTPSNPADVVREILLDAEAGIPISGAEAREALAALDLLQSTSDLYRKDTMPADVGMDLPEDEMKPEGP